ncbi:hypothetical protein L593_08150 [Salinarchaeum sp. Harcht-Bsk1]|uniref:hypothetical protein n=1 Tax=Salinarchaeum sp. Harcht-Bsk1 TaxID=1333523 RepID=UPI0003424816|nr:hypothetical protein [Salinarchaeum sp. Harcht-Bsk1]AGN01575.1 hypothetical protein L593_08150 [Salinarchaeum sp. Harcht-Bsk1]
MSSPPSHLELPSDGADASFDERARSVLQTARRHVFTPVRAAGFWSAIALPFLYVPLVATGLETEAELSVFLALLAANVVAIALGHSHSPGRN